MCHRKGGGRNRNCCNMGGGGRGGNKLSNNRAVNPRPLPPIQGNKKSIGGGDGGENNCYITAIFWGRMWEKTVCIFFFFAGTLAPFDNCLIHLLFGKNSVADFHFFIVEKLFFFSK